MKQKTLVDISMFVRNGAVPVNKVSFILVFVCIFTGCKKSVYVNNEVPHQRADAEAVNYTNGPTVLLFNEGGEYPENTLADFMYFVPLISPVPVSAVISSDNTQSGHLLSYENDVKGDRFYAACEFRMKGKGFYLNELDDDAMVEWNTKFTSNKKVLKNILDYIKFEGEGYGRIEVKGTITGSVMTVEEVEVRFDARDSESPVVVGLYDVDITEKRDGSYTVYNKKVARITKLTFERSEGVPRMGLKISAVGKDEESLGTWAHIKGAVGNFFIEPIEIDKLGNETMLEFGLVLYNREAKFTFPRAKNLIQTPEDG